MTLTCQRQAVTLTDNDNKKSVVMPTPAFNGGGTDIAMALEQVRIQDMPRTRNGRKYVMLFTDGQSSGDIVGQERLTIIFTTVG